MSQKLSSRKPLSGFEFIALMGTLSAIVAFSIDVMLPALPNIATALELQDAKNISLVIPCFVLGLGLGTFFAGPLCDALGRKPIIIGGLVIYIFAAWLASNAQNFEAMLAARVLQGFGASGPRIGAMAVVRDRYSGREMARATSFITMVFMITPALAPSIGAALLYIGDWRDIFFACVGFGLITMCWYGFRQAESLAKEKRRPFRTEEIRKGCAEIIRIPEARRILAANTLISTLIFILISVIQEIYAESYGRAASFPFWFGIIAGLSSVSFLINAYFVTRIGVIKIVQWALLTLFVISLLTSMIGFLLGTLPFPFFLLWQFALVSAVGLCGGNLTAAAMTPLGHIAGLAATLISALSFSGASIIASILALIFGADPIALTIVTTLGAALSFWLIAPIHSVPEAREAD